MSRPVSARIRALLSAAAIAAALPLAACNQPAADSALAADGLPDLPATLPLALGQPTQPVYAPAAYDMPAAPLLPGAEVADPDDYYAYADDAWGFEDSLGAAPPDYGFYYDEVEPWAWQGYDDSLMFVEPLEAGYRSYYYRPGEDYPYFIRDPEYGYGYDDGQLVAIYDSYGAVIPYADYGPRYAYASRYYRRGYDLCRASRQRHPVIAANWIERRPVLTASYSDWAQDRWQQPAWRAYHDRIAEPRTRHWQPERARRQADAVRFAAWSDQGFRTAAPPRAIPAGWTRAKWAGDARRFAPPVSGFLGNPAQRRRAATEERTRVAALAADSHEQARAATELRRVARAERSAERRVERAPSIADTRAPARVRDERRAQQVALSDRTQTGRHELLRRQDEQRRVAQVEPARQHQRPIEARPAAQERRQAQVERQQVEQRRQAQAEARAEADRRQQVQIEARRQAQSRRAEAEQRQRGQIDARQVAQQRQQAQVEVHQQARRAEAEQRQRARGEARQAAVQQRQQETRQPAPVRAADRVQQREPAAQRGQQQEQARAARAERPQHEAKPERVAQADPSVQPDEQRRGRR